MTRRAVGVTSRVEEEKGRWVVYLDLSFWRKNTDLRKDAAGADLSPLETLSKRIADYSTRREAEVAAHWIERTADRGNPHRNLGF